MVQHLRNVALLLAFCGAVSAQSRPNFSGEWKMNPDKSDYGMVPKPERMSRTIAHDEPNLRITTMQAGQRGESTTESKLVLDGTEQVNRIGNAEVKSTPRWDGAALRIDSKRPLRDGELLMQEKWVLSDDKKSITITTHITTPMGEADIKVVLEKQ